MSVLPTPRQVRVVRDVILERDAGDDRFLEIAAQASAGGLGVILLSGGFHDCGRYSLALS